tara:strand:+ start:31894 stop:34395 length:2502 start_codon:yes stop_codon:yes gene_type:complete
MKKTSIILFFLFSFLLSQNQNTYIWSGTSITTSDNLDALNLNPAGLGFNRGNQNALVFKGLEEDNYYIGITGRSNSGFGYELYYDNSSYNYSIGHGSEVSNNLYTGFKLNKKKDYSLGILYRPFDFLSLASTTYDNHSNQDYKYERYGFAIKPFEIKKIFNNSNSYLRSSNFTIGYDKTNNMIDGTFQEQYSINLSITPGIDLSYFTYDDNYGINLSFNIGNQGAQLNTYPSNSFYGLNSSSTSLVLFEYSQTAKTNINFSNNKKENYVLMNLDGYFIEEEPTLSPFDFIFEINIPFVDNQNTVGIQLRRWIDNIHKITKDDSVDGLIINLGNVKAGFGKRKEMFNALLGLKQSGKKIIVYSQNEISGSDYYLISMADEIYTHNMGSLDLKGFNLEVNYVKQLLDTLSIVTEVVKTSDFKTAGENLTRETMSNAFKENYGKLFDDFYETYINDISNAKNWTEENTKMMIDDGPYMTIKNAIEKNLITGTMYPDEFDKYINNLNQNKTNITKWEEYVNYENYSYDWKKDNKPTIAVIYAVGGIISGESNPGPSGSTLMGDITIKNAIKEARENDDIDAIVLRIDSGGGSALASDMIWREIYKTTTEDKKNKKPFIVSMSDTAASGGYYIACEADKIVANETSVTGSIGVVYLRINFSQLLNRIGIYTDNIKRGENADFGTNSRLYSGKEEDIVIESILDIYNTFKQKVIDGRANLNDIDELDEIALGRVWSGKEAKENGLIDEIGGLHVAINITKESIGITSDSEVEIIEYPEVKEFNLFGFLGDEEEKSNITNIDLENLFPEQISDELKALNIIPVIMNDDIQLLVPYNIEIK